LEDIIKLINSIIRTNTYDEQKIEDFIFFIINGFDYPMDNYLDRRKLEREI
jgi:hypothetical protein